ncbi:hypothetical protein L7F22_026813 [Adiantum nelumboides]|nr:hypothetical protein [Adiantum nelumboides]
MGNVPRRNACAAGVHASRLQRIPLRGGSPDHALYSCHVGRRLCSPRGAFETPYQRQPLDLDEDSFAIARAPLIRDRLAHIEETGGLDKIAEADDRERPNKTWAMACRWDSFSKEDLLEIAECMGGRALSVVCQTLAEEWGHCTSGLPDLVVWRYEDKKVRFCEVKGPGDRLSDKQKVWIDILSRAGCQVEVSLVSAH